MFGSAINGSLWTLNYEVLCYLGVVLVGLAGLLTRPWLFALATVCFVAAYSFNEIHPLHVRFDSLLMLALPFLIGMSFWVWRRVISWSLVLAFALFGVVYLVHITALLEPVLALALSYLMFVIGYAKIPVLAAYNRLGDYSYVSHPGRLH